ncbi:MAG: hypothetical protein CL912_01845 [Deltaproteobacteria bacterium]|nr:hypothetical protein [Deltaproteobacteria bacterium]
MASVEVDPAIALPDEVPQEEDHNEVGQVLVEVEVLCPKVKDQDDGLFLEKTTGRFSHHKVLKEPPNPGLYLKSYGSIGFPFSDHDVEKLVKAGNQIQQLEENTWELPAKIWETTNPSWTLLIKSVLKDVGQNLGVPKSRGTRGRPSALILYEPGSVVKQPTSW